jgi:hypothetical protein
MKNEYLRRQFTDSFSGYRRRLKIEEGELYDCKNLSTAYYPLLSNRKKRGLVTSLAEPGGLLAKDKLCWVDGGALYVGGEKTPLNNLSPGEKQLVSMGAYICVFPDKLYYNTAQPGDFGSMEAQYTSVGAVRISLCQADGSEYKNPTVSDSAPENPDNAAPWVDTSVLPHVLRLWSAALNEWVESVSVYTRMSFTSAGELAKLFKKDDGVEISGAALESINGNKLISALGGDENTPDYIVFPGLIDEAFTQSEGYIRIARTVPDMDYVIECRNRLWGCKYGENLNEIYCCALGDFKNWRQYMGLASDSWAASVGSDGPWTGAVNFMGYPTFFKENRIHRVSVSAIGAHHVSETVCRGVEPGSHKSLAVVNETLFYKARGAVCSYQGGFPNTVSEALGDESYSDAVAGAIGDNYYISMRDAAGAGCLFVYDIGRSLWIKEDGLAVTDFAALGSELYALSGGRLYALLGTVGETESHVDWMAESGILCYQYPDRKYLSRYNFRIQMEEGAWMDIYVQYDSSGVWERKGRINFRGLGTVTVPVRPRRCDHLRIRLEGKGEFRLFSIAKILSIGSDV